MFYTRFTLTIEQQVIDVSLLADKLGLQQLYLHTDDAKYPFLIKQDWQKNDDFFIQYKQQLIEYSQGKRQQFDLLLNPQGSDFQQQVWQQLIEIQYGQANSYLDIAKKIGNPKACRAVGMANGKNPIPIIIPCHRVIGSNGKLTGYAFGTKLKQQLLNVEYRH